MNPAPWQHADGVRKLHRSYATLRGFNVKEPFAAMLLDGSKPFETRSYDVTRGHSGHFAEEWFWVVECPGNSRKGRAKILGIIKFASAATRYTSLAEWRADRARHRVPEGSPKDWDGRGRMYAWRVEQYYALRRPLEPPEQKGNINSKPVTRALAPDSWVV